ncbi:probable leucine-rich repeat receptor-like serine/threonine-protein kinase At3g14840 [Impatiens glandulifera]|uniref:probable leucine-rich repeat receptor-like serine/threonine-protein kinase At3g14840 n=1 Tax=Impatiens glandulifera TaxID=253017 RepID=UPI001FB178A1|nr:probable leucine-rich repeat receptor-like serine/threonine-protein kinase At3g14840 [Impatiens glandulifera]
MLLLRIYALTAAICFVSTTVYGASVLPASEVETLRQIGSKLGKTNWNFSVDPCSGGSGWFTQPPPDENNPDNAVVCNCTFSNNTVCHVVSIFLKQQNLTGTLPKEFVNLPFLQEIDLTRNYLNGTIPPEWGTSLLVNITLLANRITGTIPRELGNITTLRSLVLEINQLSGRIPPELGNLTSIERLLLTSNNFSGELPIELGKLTTLMDFRIGDNNITGKIPDFIGNWRNLNKLVLQASGLEGPIPDTIFTLINITDLRISDINGTDAIFPPISNMKKLKILILRSCNLIGPLPSYLGTVTTLKTLDLSFNKLSGEIPTTYSSLSKTDFIYFTGNMLNGTVPDWVLDKGDMIDLSFNNFTHTTDNCQERSVNLFASSSNNLTSGNVSCMKTYLAQCSDSHSLHINCGGNEVTVGGIKYESDVVPGTAASFSKGSNWAFINTGHFLDNDRPSDSYVEKSASTLPGNSSLLSMDARITPISLTYYVFCLINGNYTVDLTFAEIIFTNDRTFSSLGRRIFDVYIQGTRVLKDFNIENEAGGVGIEIVRSFSAPVTDRTLEIQLRWSGKGTIAVPVRGIYGPLISAISVELPGFSPPGSQKGGISVGAVVGIVFSVVFVVILILGILWWKGCIGRKDTISDDLKGLDLQTGSFSLRQIKAATNNFDVANKIGEGGFGPVFKGVLSDGTAIAVKQLSSKSKQGNREFVTEIGMISALQHPYLVKLYGCCIEGNQLLLVYEYLENNSLARALFGPEESQIHLDWSTRYKICIGIARGLAYLHEESRLKIVHRDIKATNVLLDKDLNPKISDFGLAKLDEEENTHISTRVAGTYGYMAPEYAMRGYLTDKADVYSFGIVALEIVSGRTNTTHRPKEESLYLLDYAHILKENGTLMDIVDRRLGLEFKEEEAMTMINIALICTNVTSASRPNMSSVVSMLEDRNVPENLLLDSDSSVSNHKEKMKQMMSDLEQSDPNMSQTRSSIPWSASSTSAGDLYPITVNSSYLANRDKV